MFRSLRHNSLVPAPRLCRIGLAVAAAVLASACDVRPLDDDGGSDIPPDVQAAFNSACAVVGCHVGSSAAGGLNLSAGSSDAILGSLSSTGVAMVEPGNLYASYLALKMLPSSSLPAGTPSVAGDLMPVGAPKPLEVATILAWVAGASVDGIADGGCISPAALPANLTFAEHVYPILEGGCILSGCHTDSNNFLQLPLDDTMGAYDLLVDVPSATMTNSATNDPAVVVLDYVEPDSPDDSYLWHKMVGSHRTLKGGGGLAMPPAGPLCSRDVGVIYKWIFTGATP